MGIEDVSIHRIRLRGFWESTPLPDGRTRHVRHFGRPRLPDGRETVWIVRAGADPVTIHLNGAILTEDGTAVEVTALLQSRNTLTLDVARTELGEQVCLEIRPPVTD